MASQHSFLESFSAGNSLLLHGGGATARVRHRSVTAVAFRPQSPSECRLRLTSGTPLCLNGLRATGQSGAGGGHEDDEDFADEGLRETIKKSKKALAVQRDLLQQIVERRKIMSSMKSTIANPQCEVSGNERDSYFSSLGRSVSSGELDKKYDNDLSDGHAQPTETELTEGQPIAAYRNFLDEEKEPGNSSQVECLLADALGLSREASPGADETMIVSPSLLKISESIGVESGNLKELKEPVMDGPSAVRNDIEENIRSPPLAGPNVMNIIFAAAECAPWSKTGGLGDVAGALPKALARRGHRVMVVAPMYGMYVEPQEIGARKSYKVDGQDMEVAYFHAYIDGVDFVFLESPIFRHRENDIYGGNRVDILKRMVLFCKAAVEVQWHVPCGGVCYGDGNLLFIANDWHTALLPVYLKAYYRDHCLNEVCSMSSCDTQHCTPGTGSCARLQLCGFARSLQGPF